MEARLLRLFGPLFDRAEARIGGRVAALLDSLELFGLGYSWAGFESLAVPVDCTHRRTATRFAPGGPMARFSVGLEDIEDLKADLDRGLARGGDGLTSCAPSSSTPTPPPTTRSRS